MKPNSTFPGLKGFTLMLKTSQFINSWPIHLLTNPYTSDHVEHTHYRNLPRAWPGIGETDANGGLVVATARNCSSELQEVISLAKGSVVFAALDVTDKENIAQSVEKVNLALAGRTLDILINCAGVYGVTHGKLALMSDLEYQLSANVTGAHNVLQQFLPLMQTSKVKKVASISSIFGSMAMARDVSYALCPAYKISKAALNALMVQYALSYEEEGFIFLAWLRSNMGGQDADLTVPQGAEAVLKTIMAASAQDNGSFKMVHVPGWVKYNGQDVPW